MGGLADPAAIAEHPGDLAERFAAVRGLSLALAETLSDADATAQSMPDASPAKWHLAHITWFFETFVLRDHVPGYRLFDADWPFLFNSYYEAEGARHARPQRGLLTRPSLDQVKAYRAHVDAALLDALPRLAESCGDLIELGLHHEQQHQELLLTDLKHLFSSNPLGPAAWDAQAPSARAETAALGWLDGPVGLVEIGDAGEGFVFDCERPLHRHYLAPYALADRTITNGEWCDFIADGGYSSAGLWLDDGWSWVKREGIAAPLYWRAGDDEGDEAFTLAGWQPLDLAAPVTHISFFEADAYARWAGARLPTEQEWEASARRADPRAGNQLDRAGPVAPVPVEADGGLAGLFGNVWEWTGSAYRPYPGFAIAEGAVGEYNGKFMNGLYVLKGGSCATPRGHLRASYRNFFAPDKRWQFTGLRLARTL
ncbi:MAG: ergothioneine biosynthesis protein EgtB [Candidatus Andeanibacterium colombiense]|uniref:Ergothioneine biosynthesis protein EgtB n=1 Tax=Candidatus Andeanibacterium colombiense TaxID=3121345 RepID=A0AAJ5X5M2_9SPHN|nr:MAG: ergothioneine biosynthesis protein EgtB [Sphingomonadaceae bacterium]